MTGKELKEARRELGLTVRDLAAALRLSPENGERDIRRMERDEKPISGPISVAVEAMLAGYWEAPDEDGLGS